MYGTGLVHGYIHLHHALDSSHPHPLCSIVQRRHPPRRPRFLLPTPRPPLMMLLRRPQPHILDVNSVLHCHQRLRLLRAEPLALRPLLRVLVAERHAQVARVVRASPEETLVEVLRLLALDNRPQVRCRRYRDVVRDRHRRKRRCERSPPPLGKVGLVVELAVEFIRVIVARRRVAVE